MEKMDFIYDAFISYRHADLDKFVAEQIHKQLEGFKLPMIASDKVKSQGKTRINRIFRDADELPIASDLAAPIITALKETEFLIVICSPRTPQSAWVQREIDTFISLHGRDNILAVLIEGEPHESFPPVLLQTEREVEVDGVKSIVNIPVEPLAADVRGKNRKEVAKNIKKELIRIAAPMFHCGYDDLKQRHKERRNRRIITYLAAACAFFLCFGSFTTFQALRIQKQSAEIKEQSDKINVQYNNILSSQLNRLGEDALNLLDKGDRIGSIKTALSALPGNSLSINSKLPLVASPQYALSKALNVYENGSDILPDRILEHDTSVQFMKLSPSKERIMTIDDANMISIWEVATGKLLKRFQADKAASYLPERNAFYFISESELIYAASDAIKRYNFEMDKTIWSIKDFRVYNATVSSDSSLMAFSDSKQLLVLDTKTGLVLCKQQHQASAFDGPSWADKFAFNKNNTLLAFSSNNYTSSETGGTGEVTVINIKTGDAVNVIPTQNPCIRYLLFVDNDNLAIATTTYSSNIFAAASSSAVLFNCKENKSKWTHQIDKDNIYTLKIGEKNNDYLILQTYYSLIAVNMKDGTIFNEIHFESSISEYFPFDDNSACFIFLRDGNSYAYFFKNQIKKCLFQGSESNIKSAVRGQGYFGVLPYGSRQLVLYKTAVGSQLKQFGELEGDTANTLFNKANDKIAISFCSSNQIDVYDYSKKTKMFTINEDNIPVSYFFAGRSEEYLIVVSFNTINVYDSKTGTRVKALPVKELSTIQNCFINEKANTFVISTTDELLVYDLKSLELLNTIKSENSFFGSNISGLAISGSKYAVSNLASSNLEVYSLDESTVKAPTKSIPILTAYVSSIFYSSDGNYLFVAYKDNKVELYSSSDLKLKYTYNNLSIAVNSAAIINSSGDYILSGLSSAYLCNSKHEILAFFPSYKGVNTAAKEILSNYYSTLYTIPVYDLDMLLKEADSQLNASKRQ